jgi:hypothetical protein
LGVHFNLTQEVERLLDRNRPFDNLDNSRKYHIDNKNSPFKFKSKT